MLACGYGLDERASEPVIDGSVTPPIAWQILKNETNPSLLWIISIWTEQKITWRILNDSQASNVCRALLDGAGEHLVKVEFIGADTGDRVPDYRIRLVGQIQVTAGLHRTLLPRE